MSLYRLGQAPREHTLNLKKTTNVITKFGLFVITFAFSFMNVFFFLQFLLSSYIVWPYLNWLVFVRKYEAKNEKLLKRSTSELDNCYVHARLVHDMYGYGGYGNRGAKWK